MILAHTSVCKPRLHWLVKFRYQLVGNCFTTNLVTVHFQAKDLSYTEINWTPLGSELHPTLEFGKYSWAFGQWFNQESTANSCSSIHVPDFIILLLMWNNCSKAQTTWTRLLARVPEAMMKIVFVFASSSLKARTKCSGYSLLNWRHIIRQRCFYLLRVATLSGFYRPYRSKGGVRFVCHNTMNCTSGREVAHFSDIHRVAQKKSLTEQCLHNWLFFFFFLTHFNCLRHTEVLRHSALTFGGFPLSTSAMEWWWSAYDVQREELRPGVIHWGFHGPLRLCQEPAFAPTCFRGTRVCPFTWGLNNTCSDLNDGKCCLTPIITYMTAAKQNFPVRSLGKDRGLGRYKTVTLRKSK